MELLGFTTTYTRQTAQKNGNHLCIKYSRILMRRIITNSLGSLSLKKLWVSFSTAKFRMSREISCSILQAGSITGSSRSISARFIPPSFCCKLRRCTMSSKSPSTRKTMRLTLLATLVTSGESYPAEL